jgi:hypothetical protein
MGQEDIDKLLKAAALLAEQDYVTLLGSETEKLVAAVGKSGLAKGIKAGNIIKAAAKVLGGGGGGVCNNLPKQLPLNTARQSQPQFPALTFVSPNSYHAAEQFLCISLAQADQCSGRHCVSEDTPYEMQVRFEAAK